MAESNLKIRISAQNAASPTIQKVRTDLTGLDKAAGTASGGLSSLAKVAGVAGLVTLGVQAAGAAVELANLGNQSIAMKASFEQMAGGAEQAASVLGALTTASRGTIKEYDLMLTANRAMLLGVADSAEEFSKLMEIATVRGRAMGLSTTQAFGDIVTGIGRMSPLILDNLGIVVDQAAAQEAYAATLGKTANSLSDAERKQALVNAVIESSADILATANDNANALAGEGMAQLNTAWGNFRAALGESLGPIFDARAKDVATGIAKITAEIDKQNEGEAFRSTLAGTRGSYLLAGISADPEASSNVLRIAIENTKRELDAAIAEYTRKAQNAQAEILSIYSSTPNLSMSQAGEIFQSQLTTVTGDAVALRAELAKLESAFDMLNGTIAETKAESSNLGALTDSITPDVSIQQAMRGIQQEIDAQLEVYVAAKASYATALAQGNEAAVDVAGSYIDNVRASVSELIKEYNALAETVGGRRIEGVRFGDPSVIYQTAEALAAEQKAAEDAATALELMAEAGNKLDGLYDTLLDSGNIDGAKASFEEIQGVLQGVVQEWLSQGKTIEEISGTLLPKLIGELDGVIAAQIEAAATGQTAGVEIGDGFLAAVPGIAQVIEIINALTGAASAAGASIRATVDDAIVSANRASRVLSSFAPAAGAGTVGRSRQPDIFGPPSLGRAPSPDRTSGLSDLNSQRNRWDAGLGGRSFSGGVGASYGGGGGGGGGSGVDSQLNSLASRIKSVLTGALKSGIDLDAILPRQDAVEEPARRLADIAVRGFESPWVDYVKNTFPEIWKEIESAGDPKAAAASILRDFEDGLRPELLDKGRAKDLVRRALLGDQNTAALANEIAAELSGELGISLQQAQAAAAGVLGTKTDAAGGEDGLDGSTVAGKFADSFIGAMSGMMERFKGAGQTAGSSWGVGFLASVEGGVPPRLIELLVSLVAPGVALNLATTNSRTGAS